MKRFKDHSAFYPGDKVSWNDQEGHVRIGRVVRVNPKTISVEEDGDPDGSIIADDMGLGKTVQVIVMLLKLKEEGAIAAPR